MRSELIHLAAALLLAPQGPLSLAARPPDVCRADASVRTPHASPSALAATADGRLLFIACAADRRVAVFEPAVQRVTRDIPVPACPSGLALSRDGTRLYVTCAMARSTVCRIDVATGKILEQIPAGHTAVAPVLSPDERTLYVCNRFSDDVSLIGLREGKELRRVKVQRQPIAAALSPDGRHLLVANHLHAGRADVDVAAAAISVIDTTSATVVKEIPLSNGSGLLRDIAIAPDGQYACVTHVLARFHFVPRTVHFGWINENAISLIDLRSMSLFSTVVLDERYKGAANPWAAAWSPDGQCLGVTHAGTHELSLINVPALLHKLNHLPAQVDPPSPVRHARFAFYQQPRRGPARSRAEVFDDFNFLSGLRERVALPGHGPRALLFQGHQACVANYFSDSLSLVQLEAASRHVTSIPLSPQPEWPAPRQGEFWFNDATLCFQGWQSCASCHDDDARVDGLNWDLLNDGNHNPKNVKSLLLSSQTPPMMTLRVRESAETAVRAGLYHILFADVPPEIPATMDAYLQSLQPVPSPHLLERDLSAAARRGERIFSEAKAGCADCHPPPFFTDLQAYDVGTAGDYDKDSDRFDTPTLVELWRTAPYLHDGSAPTLQDLLTTSNSADRHGTTSHLTPREIDDLAAYLLSL